MLRIKDDCDLKELEKFGFNKKYTTYRFSADGRYDNRATLRINGGKYSNRELWCDFFEINDEILDKIFDLIIAGIVEKVEE